jgi:hypothetical protein
MQAVVTFTIEADSRVSDSQLSAALSAGATMGAWMMLSSPSLLRVDASSSALACSPTMGSVSSSSNSSSPSYTQCSGHGACAADSTCMCQLGYTGLACGYCDSDYVDDWSTGTMVCTPAQSGQANDPSVPIPGEGLIGLSGVLFWVVVAVVTLVLACCVAVVWLCVRSKKRHRKFKKSQVVVLQTERMDSRASGGRAVAGAGTANVRMASAQVSTAERSSRVAAVATAAHDNDSDGGKRAATRGPAVVSYPPVNASNSKAAKPAKAAKAAKSVTSRVAVDSSAPRLPSPLAPRLRSLDVDVGHGMSKAGFLKTTTRR